jgi:CheY-like chemotaxis protein
MNILVVEDNPSHLKLARHILNAAGYDVCGVQAAEQALDLIKSDKPQLMLVDMELPGMDGLLLVRQLKADPATSGIHIAAVTSFPERYPRTEVMAAGCEAYFTKPINTRTLPSHLGRLMK